MPFPPIRRPSSSAPSSPPFTLSVATKLTIWSEARAESTITVGTPRRLRLLDRPHERLLVEGGEDDPVDALAREGLHHLHLLLAVVLAQGALPEHLHVDALRGEVALGRQPPRRGWSRQNSWVVPLGTKATRRGFAALPFGPSARRQPGKGGERRGRSRRGRRGRAAGCARVRPSRPCSRPRSSGRGSRRGATGSRCGRPARPHADPQGGGGGLPAADAVEPVPEVRARPVAQRPDEDLGLRRAAATAGPSGSPRCRRPAAPGRSSSVARSPRNSRPPSSIELA